MTSCNPALHCLPHPFPIEISSKGMVGIILSSTHPEGRVMIRTHYPELQFIVVGNEDTKVVRVVKTTEQLQLQKEEVGLHHPCHQDD